MKNYSIPLAIIIILAFLSVNLSIAQNRIYLYAPDSSLSLSIYSGKKIYYSLYNRNKEPLIENSPISMQLASGITLGADEKLVSSNERMMKESIKNYFGKNEEIAHQFKELELKFEKNFSLLFRLYNNAFTYRFVSNFKQDIIVENEEASVRFAQNMDFYYPVDQTGESFYELKDFYGVDSKSKIFLPLLLKSKPEQKTPFKVLITEADVIDYPSWILKKTEDWLTNFNGYFPKFPLSFKQGGYLDYTPMAVKEADFIAKTRGARNFPWRVFIFPKSDAELVNNDLIYSLSEPTTKDSDWTWVKTGMCVWEYWHNLNLSGVDFETKQNTQTYLYYLDFASKNGIPYMIVDWKWSNVHDIFHLNQEIDIKYLCQEAKKKNVKIILWTLAHTLYKDMEKNIDFISELGASGVKVDFFDRDDQLSNRMYEEIAKACAKKKLVVDFHGCSKPTGLQRKYPNILNYEAVKGNETNIFSSKPVDPKHHLHCAFIRGAVSPQDFTPGSFHNVNLGDYRPSTNNPVTVGTRMHELALLLLFEAPLQMLCDAPTAYAKEPQLLNLIAKLPTTWNKTLVLDADLDHRLLVAKKKEKTWYISGISEEYYEKDISFSFLETGNYILEVYKDGINAHKSSQDVAIEKLEISNASSYKVIMKPQGGIILKITPTN